MRLQFSIPENLSNSPKYMSKSKYRCAKKRFTHCKINPLPSPVSCQSMRTTVQHFCPSDQKCFTGWHSLRSSASQFTRTLYFRVNKNKAFTPFLLPSVCSNRTRRVVVTAVFRNPLYRRVVSRYGT